MKIRKAKKKDDEKILELLNSDPNLSDSDGEENSTNDVKELFRKPNIMFVYEKAGEIIGLITGVFYKKAKKIYLYHLIVDNKNRRKNIASKLINYVEKLGRKKKVSLIFFYSEVENKKMQRFAKKKRYKRGKKFLYFSKRLK